MKEYQFTENGLRLIFRVSEDNRTTFCGFGFTDDKADEKTCEDGEAYPVEIGLLGSGFNKHHGYRKICGAATQKLVFDGFTDEYDSQGRHIVLAQKSDELSVKTHYIIYKNLAVVRAYSEIAAVKPVTLEYVSSLQLPCIFREENWECYEKIKVFTPYSAWHGEMQWRENSLADLGMTACHGGGINVNRVARFNTGSWSAKESVPTGFITDGERVYNWQIEANGSWYSEMGNDSGRIYLGLSGPTFEESAWAVNLAAGDTFQTVAAAVCLTRCMEDCVRDMTEYRRRNFAVYRADKELPSQFNGYMHGCWESPTTELLLKEIDTVAALKIPYFIVDAGWFCKESRWNALGDWLHPNEPFEDKTLKEIFDYARTKGLKCGLWMELEDIGIRCSYVKEVDRLLMKRRGKNVCDNERYFFDFSLKETREYMTKVVDFVVGKYGVEYFKFDYNIDCPVGCDNHSDYFGEGLLNSNRGYLLWLRELRGKYPDLLIEGCSSGGMRTDYATLYEYALGNISDQIYYNRVPYIVSNAAAYLVPERVGVWAYPLADATREQLNINFVNAAFFRVQYSGPCEKLNEEQLEIVRNGLDFYDSLREFKRTAYAFFPNGFCRFFDKSVTFGYQNEERAYLAVYNLDGEKEKKITCPFRIVEARLVFPYEKNAAVRFCKDVLTVVFDSAEDACIISIEKEKSHG